MEISKEQLEKFKQLYKEKFNVELDDQEALECAQKLIRLMHVATKTIE